MPRICDRSPCNGLMAALGKFVFGDIEDNRPQGFVLMASVDLQGRRKRTAIEIEYCPFCGTQIQQVNDLIVERFMRPRRRRISRKANIRPPSPRGESTAPKPIAQALKELKRKRRGFGPSPSP